MGYIWITIMQLPYWIKKTVYGSLVCVFCGSLVMQTAGAWVCLNNDCEKHADVPAETQHNTPNYFQINSVASGTSLPSPSQPPDDSEFS